jgi:hypothetical protein
MYQHPSEGGAKFCNFQISSNLNYLEEMKIINPEDYPEYFI